jgi:hypothetical protein
MSRKDDLEAHKLVSDTITVLLQQMCTIRAAVIDFSNAFRK